MTNENQEIFSKLVDVNNQLNLLNYIYAGLSYSYDEMLEKLDTNGDSSKLMSAVDAFGSGLKISAKDFQKLCEYIDLYPNRIKIYLSNKMVSEVKNEIDSLKEEKEKLEKQMEKIINT